jgi:hypothetical protein
MKIDNTSSKIMFSVLNIGENKVCEYNHYVSSIYSNIINLCSVNDTLVLINQQNQPEFFKIKVSLNK